MRENIVRKGQFADEKVSFLKSYGSLKLIVDGYAIRCWAVCLMLTHLELFPVSFIEIMLAL
jgi:hypothetical protein